MAFRDIILIKINHRLRRFINTFRNTEFFVKHNLKIQLSVIFIVSIFLFITAIYLFFKHDDQKTLNKDFANTSVGKLSQPTNYRHEKTHKDEIKRLITQWHSTNYFKGEAIF